jgi:phosphate/sulfate permease
MASTILFITGGVISAGIAMAGADLARNLGAGFMVLSLVAFTLHARLIAPVSRGTD